ncbi:MAG: hypothetical protein Q4F05_06600 [bacterium]|nr:hypothetical protein [bacterium]
MLKKKIVRKHPVKDKSPMDENKRINATKTVKQLFDQNPDTSVYSKRYQYKQTDHTED